MHRYVVKRLLMMIPVLLGITILVFLMLHLTPGDPARSMLGDTASPAEIDEPCLLYPDLTLFLQLQRRSFLPTSQSLQNLYIPILF